MNNDTYYMSASEIATATQQYTNSLHSSLDGLNGVVGEVDNFINGSSAELQGAAWDSVREHMGTYRDTINSLRDLNTTIDSEMESALKIIQDFLEPDSDLNTADLPKFEEQKANLEAEIKSLEEENVQLEQVQCEPIQCTDGTNGYCGEDCSARDAAQQKIVQNQQRIRDVLTPQLDEVNRLINKINQFTNEILPKVNAKLEELYNKVMDLNQKVKDLLTTLPEGSSLRDKYEQQTRTYDLSTIEGRFLKIYDELTEKWGYSEWGAKAIIASMYGTNNLLQSDRFQGDNPRLPGYGLCQWEYAKNGGSVDTAQKMEDWCKANGYDHTTIEGQCAWIHHWLPELSKGYHIDNLNDMLSTGGKDQYYEMANKFSVYHQGTQGVEGKGYYRAMNKDLWEKFFPLIDQRNSLKTASTSNIEKPPTLQMDVAESTGKTTTTPVSTDTTQGTGHWNKGSYQTTSSSSENQSGSYTYTGGGGSISSGVPSSYSSNQGLVTRNDSGGVLSNLGLQTSQKLGNVVSLLGNDTPSNTVTVNNNGGGGSPSRSYYVPSDNDNDMVELPVANDEVIEPEIIEPSTVDKAPSKFEAVALSEPTKPPQIDIVENKPNYDLGPQPGEKLVEMSVTELTKGTPQEVMKDAIRNPVATAAVTAIAAGAAGVATVAALKHDEDIDEDEIEGLKAKDYY